MQRFVEYKITKYFILQRNFLIVLNRKFPKLKKQIRKNKVSMEIKKLLGLPLYLKYKESKIRKHSLLVYPAYDFSLYLVLRNKGDFALVMDENFKIKFISTQKYVNIDYKFEPEINFLLENKSENQEITLSEDFFNYFRSIVGDPKDVSTPSICLYEKMTINSFFILNPDNESKGYYVDTSVKIYISNIKTKYKETIDKDDTRTVYSHLGTLKYNSKNFVFEYETNILC
jgi:hypothetical protein